MNSHLAALPAEENRRTSTVHAGERESSSPRLIKLLVGSLTAMWHPEAQDPVIYGGFLGFSWGFSPLHDLQCTPLLSLSPARCHGARSHVSYTKLCVFS